MKVFISRLVLAGFLTGLEAPAAVYYVAPSGHDGAAGTLDAPLQTMAQAQTLALPGDTVYFRGGTYAFVSSSDSNGVTLDKSGTSGNPIRYWAYAGEIPVFDFVGMTAPKRIKGVNVTGSWLHLRGLEMKNVPQTDALKAHEDWCIYVNGGSHNIFERLNLHNNMGPGLFIVAGGANLILNCDSHDNYDPYSYTNGVLDPGQNADGFGFHSRNVADSGTVFRGCRAWWNSDDGFDFIDAATSVTVESCWSWNNGYKPETTQSTGNGNGFKVGGYGLPPADYPSTLPRHVVRLSLAFDNLAAGFYQNHHPIANYYYNNTSFNNKSSNFNLLGYDLGSSSGVSLGILRNNIALTGTALANATTGNGVDAAYNSWNLNVAVSAADFHSTDTAGVGGPRQSDGSLPNIPFMQLKSGSPLIDAGTNVGLPYAGAAPDLGAFEFQLATGIFPGDKMLRAATVLDPNGNAHVRVFDVSGRKLPQAWLRPQTPILWINR